jgi:4-carboxymuconolactone decarboxylase
MQQRCVRDRRTISRTVVNRLTKGELSTLERKSFDMKRPSGGQGAQLAKVAPGLNHYTQTILYDEVWERPGLSKRERCMITLASMIATFKTNLIPGHMAMAMENGITREELGEIITHLAFYTSWPNATTAARLLLDLTEKMDAQAAAQKE